MVSWITSSISASFLSLVLAILYSFPWFFMISSVNASLSPYFAFSIKSSIVSPFSIYSTFKDESFY